MHASCSLGTAVGSQACFGSDVKVFLVLVAHRLDSSV